MQKKLTKKNKIVLVIIILLMVISISFIKKSYSYQTLYDYLPENSIIIGEDVYIGEVNPNNIANAAINYYKKSNENNIKIYKYNGLDEHEKPIWGTYSDESESYIEISENEIKKIEKILEEKYELDEAYE